MREEHLLEHIGRLARQTPAPGVVVGPGDDCAAVRCLDANGGAAAGAPLLLLTTDQLIEGRHYAPGTPVDLVARKAVARSVSDIAAMAGTPAWSLGTGALPAGTTDTHARELIDAMHRWARHFGCPMIGGDLASLPALPPGAPCVLTVTVGGWAHPARGPVLRSGAQPGDTLWISGALGGSFTSGRHLTFTPRVDLAQHIATTWGGGLHALMDLSDGLGRDGARMARASGCALHVQAAELPVHAGCTWQQAMSDGEDYELLISADPACTPDPAWGLHRIGRADVGEGCTVWVDGQALDASAMGWEHT
jgi:thiamine-monophosphate kinase